MHKLIIIILLAILALMLSSCDEREGIRPEMEMTVVNDHLYSDGGNCNLDSTLIEFRLTGSSGFISEVKIMVNYDKTTSLFVGTGSEDYVITDEEGFAQGTYKVVDTLAYGVDTFRAHMERFPSVREEKLIHIDLLPDIMVHAELETIQIGESLTVFATVTDQFNNVVAGKGVIFSSDKGIFSVEDAVLTNTEGIAQNVYTAGEEPGEVTIEVSLEICSHVKDSMTLLVE